MNTHREEAIRARAHQLWEDEGRPEGREREHWEAAEREFGERKDDETPNGEFNQQTTAPDGASTQQELTPNSGVQPRGNGAGKPADSAGLPRGESKPRSV